MKKIRISLLLLICLMCCSSCGYGSENIESKAEQGTIEYVDITNQIVADTDTHILYYFDNIGQSAYMCPYYSKNGKLCRYEDGKIIEVDDDD